MLTRLNIWIPTVMLALMTACGDDGEGNDDTLLTGFSGVVILAIVIFIIMRSVKKRR